MNTLDTAEAWIRQRELVETALNAGGGGPGVPPGSAVFQGTPQLKHYNPMGVVHGGWFATLLDFALGCAVQTTLGVGVGYTTAHLSVHMVRAATIDTGPLRAIGKAVHSGRQMATSEARIVAPDGKLYAHATTTCVVFPVRVG